jgi:tRNA G18 (ribose-2'-O)-methylase SpoU
VPPRWKDINTDRILANQRPSSHHIIDELTIRKVPTTQHSNPIAEMPSPSVAFTRHLGAAWARWTQRRAEQTLALSPTELQAQYELLAAGVAATLSDESVELIWRDEESAESETLWTLLMPLAERIEHDGERIHFLLVVIAELLARGGDTLLEGKGVRGTARALWLVETLVVPIVKSRMYARLHAIALVLVEKLVQLDSDRVATLLGQRVLEILLAPPEASDREDDAQTGEISYVALCRVFQIVLTSTEAFVRVAELNDQVQRVCVTAIEKFDRQPRYLRAVAVHLMPALVASAPATIETLVHTAITTWQGSASAAAVAARGAKMRASSRPAQGAFAGSQVSNLLYMLCLLLPKDPTLIRETGLQQLIAFALTHDDPLLRKQALHLLKISFSHYAIASTGDKDLEIWQSFILASDVIQLHHEPHLLEQVWPQVDNLLHLLLLVPVDDHDQDKIPQAEATATAWPVKFTFPWIQSLLMRVFRHENPVVRRMFLSNFMETCVQQLSKPEWNPETREVTPSRLHADSFLVDPLFESFVLERVLRACNDPLMYKSSRREPFQAATTRFFASFLAFKLAFVSRASSPGSPGLLNRYVRCACDAVFGEGSVVHSPEAIISSLEALEDPVLQRVVATHADVVDALDETSLNKMRFMLELYVLRSFPLSMRTKLLHALQEALTRGFTQFESLSLECVARILSIIPASHLVASHAAGLVAIHKWLRTSDAFRASLSDSIKGFLTPSDNIVASASVELTAPRLARLLLFTADVHAPAGDDDATRFVLARPLTELVGDVSLFDHAKMDRLFVVLGALELELRDLGANEFTGAGIGLRDTNAPVVFLPRGVYGAHGLSCTSLFQAAVRRTDQWLLQDDNDVADECEDDQMQFQQDVLTSCAALATQLATFAMEEDGDLGQIHELSELCQRLKAFLSSHQTSANGSAKLQLQKQAIALRFLSVVSSQSLALDAIEAFDGETVVPLLLQLEANRQGTNSSRYLSDCIFLFASSKWRVISNVVEAAAYVPTTVLRAVFDHCVDALFSAGSDPYLLTDMVHVLSIAMARLGGVLVQGDTDHGEQRLNEVFNEIWMAYGHAKPKPDSLTRAVIYCLVQPAFMRRTELVQGKGHTPLMKKWVRTIVGFGEVYRPNVLFHLACRLVQIWRVDPRAALPFADEIVELLLYREPIIADKQKSPTLSDVRVNESLRLADSPNADASSGKSALSAKDRFVRFIVLSFLDEMSIDDQVAEPSAERELLDTVLRKLLETNFGDDVEKQQMLHSDGFGRRLRCWQALTVLSKHITSVNVVPLSELVWRAFAIAQLPVVRFYMEVLAMRLALRFPDVTIHRHVLPLLRNFNLMPQIGASVLLIAGFFINHTMLGNVPGSALDDTKQAFARSLLEALLPWLNASHGHTRVMVQFLLGVLLPRYMHVLESSDTSHAELAFFHGVARFLSENKESKRMFRRQSKQFDSFQPEFECTMLGLLTSAGMNEFNELFPNEDAASLSAQIKGTMDVLYEQFNREHFAAEQAQKQASKSSPVSAAKTTGGGVASAINVQRKIDTSAILLDESVLPVAMKDRDELVDLNIRQKRRQEVILCATLVDKVPNLAGLARTCEIFNAKKLIVPSVRVCDDEVFQTISVTANKWIPMEEVREEGLVDALSRWKRDGYTIVAVEQTASSQCLSRFQFPEKIVIVLGKEKEGIPVDVLQMVDVCVEIPQFGLIRSLNVHVSGAILLWEYTQQRLISGK